MYIEMLEASNWCEKKDCTYFNASPQLEIYGWLWFIYVRVWLSL